MARTASNSAKAAASPYGLRSQSVRTRQSSRASIAANSSNDYNKNPSATVSSTNHRTYSRQSAPPTVQQPTATDRARNNQGRYTMNSVPVTSTTGYSNRPVGYASERDVIANTVSSVVDKVFDQLHTKHQNEMAKVKFEAAKKIEAAIKAQNTDDKVKQLNEENTKMKAILGDNEIYRTGLWCRACLTTTKNAENVTLLCCCNDVYYCSQACQHRDWSNHMKKCARVTVKQEM